MNATQEAGSPSKICRTRGDIFSQVAFWQGAGFFSLILVIWVKEILDFPSLFYDIPPAPPDWLGASLLSAATLIIGFIVVANTFLQQSRILHGFIRVCSYCKKVHVGEASWEQMETFISDHTMAEFTHGMCPSCFTSVMDTIEPGKPASKDGPA